MGSFPLQTELTLCLCVCSQFRGNKQHHFQCVPRSTSWRGILVCHVAAGLGAGRQPPLVAGLELLVEDHASFLPCCFFHPCATLRGCQGEKDTLVKSSAWIDGSENFLGTPVKVTLSTLILAHTSMLRMYYRFRGHLEALVSASLR